MQAPVVTVGNADNWCITLTNLSVCKIYLEQRFLANDFKQNEFHFGNL